MLVQAGLEHKTTAEIADAYEAAFHADEALVNILPAHVFPRATEYITEMVELAEALEDRGMAYATDAHNVYYAVGAFPGYGQLSRNSLEDLRAGHRGEVEPDKRDPADFALWKAAGPRRSLKWPTDRWGDGFPGWHLECSAMARRWAIGSTCIPAGSTTSSRTTRTRSPSRRRWSAARRPASGSTGSIC